MSAPSMSETSRSIVGELVRLRAGLWFPANRQHDLDVGIQRAMRRLGTGEQSAYLARLRADAAVLDDLIAELTVGETYFFRDPAQFDLLRTEVLPEIRRLRGAGHSIRMWSAGCATGEEAYSLAILAEEEGLAAQVAILATDITRTALARAREASYGDWSLRGRSREFVDRYFQRRGNRVVIAPRFRRAVEFKYLNLAFDAYPSFLTGTWGMDLVLCRNVLIYLDARSVGDVAKRLYASLAAGGWLITGPSDPLLADHAPFAVTATPAGVIYRKPADSPAFASAAPKVDPVAAIVEPEPPGAADLAASPPAAGPGEPATASGAEPVSRARVAAADGDWHRVVALTEAATGAEAGILRARALAGLGRGEAAERVAREAAARYPTFTELAFLHAILLMGLDRDGEAEAAMRRALYLDRSLAAAHFALGAVLRRLGRRQAAARAYRNARDLARARPADEIVPLSDGEPAGRLAEAAAAQLMLVENEAEDVA